MMLYFSLLIAFFSTLSYINILIVDICNSKTYAFTQSEEVVKVVKRMSTLRWVSIMLMSIFWPLSIVLIL
jgi:hypothetical protein